MEPMSPRNDSPAAGRFPRLSRSPSTISRSDFRPVRPCLGGLSGLAPEPDGSPLFTSSPSVTCQRYEPRKCPGPLAVSRYRDAAFPVEGSGRPLRSRSIFCAALRVGANHPFTCVPACNLSVYASQWLLPDTTQDSIHSCLAQALPWPPFQTAELNALARRNSRR